MEIQNGEYIRTTDGIKKIIKVNEGSNATYYGKYIVEPKYKGSNSINAKNIIKHSFNIAEILEEDDYVNGMRVSYVRFPNGPYEPTEIYVLDKHINFIFASDIKSVITHEQMEAMEYEIK